APPFGKGRWLRLGEDGGIDDAGSNAWPRFQTQSQKLILSTISAPPFSKGRNKAMHKAYNHKLTIVTRNILQESILLPFEIHFAVIIVHSVGNHEIFRPELKIVPCNLIKYILGDIYFRGFAFHQNLNTALRVKNNYIVSFFYAVHQ